MDSEERIDVSTLDNGSVIIIDPIMQINVPTEWTMKVQAVQGELPKLLYRVSKIENFNYYARYKRTVNQYFLLQYLKLIWKL